MKSPFLILFIIFNLLAINLVSASNMYKNEQTESHSIQLQEESDLGKNIDEAACDHFCHISSHIMGMINQDILFSDFDTSRTYDASDEEFYSLITSPPFQPPKA